MPVTTPVPTEEVRGTSTERIDVRVALAIGIAWFVLPSIGAALEPAARQADPGWAEPVGYLMDVLFLTMLLGLALRRRWGLVASLAGAVVLTAFAVACPISGHHGFGLWWFGQMVCSLALVVGTVWALRLPLAAAPRRS